MNEVADTGELPSCAFCDQSLRTGIWREAAPEGEAGDAIRDDEGGRANDGAGAAGGGEERPGAGPGEARDECRCGGSGGPMPGDPATCFQCGGRLPDASDDRDADTDSGRYDTAREAADARVEPDPPRGPRAGARPCTLVLADGRRFPVGEGLLVSRCDPSVTTDMRVAPVGTPTVSRKHAWLRMAGGRVEVVDLGSTNGTWVDGSRIEPLRPTVVAPDGDVAIAFGRGLRATLTFDRLSGRKK